ncbi:penicillin-binding transpeptidase domain-containing protein [Kitasatospora cathayae]|uniref:Penicillin-binding transpeptidase domain-containing protein n=1 Tax=Kitasatospora cathayae TaxID=3004092 RepID=A0ABY7PW59_9ACTN|nr:penicillin-binding transpeptidase domain-containing protein [Kitasatospora sp. HUAS 3-15]WBP84427.1 penicillin-binding transpeptidase domain-containing protein [Kitasatospora sp. HUAS 3-15]
MYEEHDEHFHEEDHHDDHLVHADHEQAPGRSRSRRVWLVAVGGVFAALVVVGGYGAYNVQPGTLTSVARDQFGLGLQWRIGIPSRDATIPVPGNKDEAAAEYIGQSQIQVNSLLMASVAATVQSGTFRQPVLREDAKRVTAPGRLPADVAQSLRSMMARTATQGTARAPMSGLSGQIGAKTGTVEAGDRQATNSWFIAYRNDLAVAAEVEGGGHGNSAAGVAAAQVLKAGGKG